MIIDAHTHIIDEKIDTNRVLSNMEVGEPAVIVESACEEKDFDSCIELIKNNGKIYASLGIHPSYDNLYSNQVRDRLLTLAKENEKVLSIGEIGLDYHYDNIDKENQIRVYKEQIEIADSLNLPLMLHIRDAHGDNIKVLADMKKYIKNGIYLHCYSGSIELVEEYDKYDALYGFGGVITFKNAKKDNLIREIGLNKILTETDCPYLTPEPYRGQVNYPEYVRFVYNKLADIFSVGINEIEKKVEINFRRFFKRFK